MRDILLKIIYSMLGERLITLIYAMWIKCLLDMGNMLRECGYSGAGDLYYKLSGTSFEGALSPTENDDDVLVMIELIYLKKKLIEVYVVSIDPILSQPQIKVKI